MHISEEFAMPPAVTEKIAKAGVIAVIVIDQTEKAVPMAKALVSGGVDVIELTLRTGAALEAAGSIIKEVPEMMVGIGTVLTPDQVRVTKEMGAGFAVSPGCNPSVIRAARECGLPFAPGISTPSDIETAVELGCRVLKYFPAETSGGLKHLESMAAPYKHLGLTFIPLGGIKPENASGYLSSPLVCAVGGSWIATRSLIDSGDWDTVTRNAREIRRLIEGMGE